MVRPSGDRSTDIHVPSSVVNRTTRVVTIGSVLVGSLTTESPVGGAPWSGGARCRAPSSGSMKEIILVGYRFTWRLARTHSYSGANRKRGINVRAIRDLAVTKDSGGRLEACSGCGCPGADRPYDRCMVRSGSITGAR